MLSLWVLPLRTRLPEQSMSRGSVLFSMECMKAAWSSHKRACKKEKKRLKEEMALRDAQPGEEE